MNVALDDIKPHPALHRQRASLRLAPRGEIKRNDIQPLFAQPDPISALTIGDS